MPNLKKLDGSSGESPTCGLPHNERQEEILRTLSELTRLRPNDRSLSPDFRLQLQLLECSVQQHRALQQLAEQQRRAAMQLEAIHSQGTQCQEVMQQRLSEVVQGLEKVGQRLQKQEEGAVLRERLRGVAGFEDPDPFGATFAPEIDDSPPSNDKKAEMAHHHDAYKSSRSQASLHDMIRKAQQEMDASEPKEPHMKKTSSKSDLDMVEEHWLNRIVKSAHFDIFCGLIIACNAATMGLQTNQTIEWQLQNPGSQAEAPVSQFVKNSGYFYITFYVIELLLKLIVFRRDFFFSEGWKWNLFDSLLVLVGMYDIGMDAATAGDKSSSTTDVSWMRLLRLLKMTKLLRVVRVMRIFRVLRMMMNSIVGSMMTLMWSILMLSLMMYVFSLCFIQIICGYLGDTPLRDIDTTTLELTQMYWGNVYQSIITLYYAVTGGADWEPLAQPVRQAGEAYYMLFLFYIAFTAFAVLNVLTGLYVDTATKISEQDDNTVGEELNQRPETKDMREFFVGIEDVDDHKDHKHGRHTIHHGKGVTLSKRDLITNLDAAPVKAFLKMAELTASDCRRIFAMLDFDNSGKVSLEEFIAGCLHSKSASQALDMMALLSETKRSFLQNRVFMTYVEDQFQTISGMVQDANKKIETSPKGQTAASASPTRNRAPGAPSSSRKR